MMPEKIQSLSNTDIQAKLLNDRLKSAAESQDWEAVASLLPARNAALENVDDLEIRETLLRASAELTDDILKTAKTARDEVSEQMSAINQGQRAALAYGK